jgi:hypothetical protein
MMSDGAIAGIIIGVLVFALIILGVIVFWNVRRSNLTARISASSETVPVVTKPNASNKRVQPEMMNPTEMSNMELMGHTT